MQVSSNAVTGAITTSTSPLRIGGNAVWPEFFSGLIDDVRVYNRALTATEIQSDMATPVGGTPVPTYTISGSIFPASAGNGALVTLGGAGSATTTANASGAFSFAGLSNGSYTVSPSRTGYAFTPGTQNVTVNGANVSAVSFTGAPTGGGQTGLVAAYSFNEGTGTATADATGNGHTGTVSGATWNTAGKYGAALSFDGMNDWVRSPTRRCWI